MSRIESYKDKTFIVDDADARIRKPTDLMQIEAGKIPKGTRVTVDKIKVVATGNTGSIVFAHVLSDDGAKLGWTSTRNFRGKFVNETLGAVEPPTGANRFGPNAAWEAGSFLRQVTLVDIVDARLQIERIALDTLDAYLDLVEAAAKDGIQVAINSGFRSYPEQKLLFDGFKKKIPGFNQAAPPGTSKHQNGIAFDINVPGGAGNPAYDWLTVNAPSRGFVRTVNKEPWHWEFDPRKAGVAVAKNTFKTGNVTV